MNDFARRLRDAARARLPEGAFLRRDRGDALYVTDAPLRGGPVDWAAAGFVCRESGGLARLTPSAVWLARLEALYPEPPDPLCRSLRRFSGPPDDTALKLFARAVKRLDGGECDPRYSRDLRQRAAVCLREHNPGGGLYACALANHLIEKEREL